MELGLLLHGCSLCSGLLLEGNACKAYLNRLGYYHIMWAQITLYNKITVFGSVVLHLVEVWAQTLTAILGR